MEWFVLCSVHDTRHFFPIALRFVFKCIMRFVMLKFRVHISHPYGAVGCRPMHVRIIRNLFLLFVAFHGFSTSAFFSCLHIKLEGYGR